MKYLILAAIFIIALASCSSQNGTILTPTVACWIESAANAASSAFTQAGAASSSGALAASALAQSAGYGCVGSSPGSSPGAGSGK